MVTYPKARSVSVALFTVANARAIPQDVQELALGPDSIMRSANPQAIRRVPLELPPGVFTESGVLERELRLGARYPEVRSGNVDASVITGRGVQALQAGFDTQVRAAQAQFARLFTELVSLCFEVDEKIFGSMTKEIKGVDDGTPFNMKYVPSRQIAGEYGVDVRYGIMSGGTSGNATDMFRLFDSAGNLRTYFASSGDLVVPRAAQYERQESPSLAPSRRSAHTYTKKL